MSRGGGFCPFIAGGAGDPLHPLHSNPLLYGEKILRRMNVELIPPDKVTLHPSLLKK
jgi:hypothetical protein